VYITPDRSAGEERILQRRQLGSSYTDGVVGSEPELTNCASCPSGDCISLM
jgi:hypothetical protein